MAPPLKSILYNQLKYAVESGRTDIPLTKPYVTYKESELQELVDRYLSDADNVTIEALEAPAPPPPPTPAPELRDVGQSRAISAPAPRPLTGAVEAHSRPLHPDEWNQYRPSELARLLGVPFSDLGAERAGLTFNSHGPNDPLRVDTQGRVWFQDEILKPAIPKPRARRVVRYQDFGSKKVERRDTEGRLDESFEVAGDTLKDLEVKVTLPSWQVGTYKDPRLPFKIHVYNDVRGFDWADVVRHYGGMDLIPSGIKRIYVGGDLCFDIRTTREVLQREYRDRALGRIID